MTTVQAVKDAMRAVKKPALITHGQDDNLDRVERMDVQTGSVSIWYTAPFGTRMFILGFDGQGHPILALSPSSTSSTQALMLLTRGDQIIAIAGEQEAAVLYCSWHCCSETSKATAKTVSRMGNQCRTI